MKLILLACLMLAALALWWSRAATDLAKIGAAAPAFRLANQHGKTEQLSDYQGHWLVLYFYPKDDTYGCTKEACQFRDNSQAVEKLGAKVVGISVDSAQSHAKFAEKHQLPFTLLADENGDVARRYGVLKGVGILHWSSRVTFLIAPNGKIAKVYESVDTTRHSAEIIEDLKTLKAA
ncbi:MAG: peroxiredoxin [Methylophilaceae bacterium]